MNARNALDATLRPGLRAFLHDAAVQHHQRMGHLKAASECVAARHDIVVLTLHRIVPDERVDLCRSPKGMVLRESLFRELLDFLSETADIISPWRVRESSAHAGKPRVLLTFDDGWVDNFTVAKRHLRDHGALACFFLTTDLLGQAEPFWPERCAAFLRCADRLNQPGAIRELLRSFGLHLDEHAAWLNDEDAILRCLKRFERGEIEERLHTAHAELHAQHGPCGLLADDHEALMSWQQVRELADDGHLMASHSASHALLPLVEQSALQHELEAPLEALREHVRHSAAWISYPNGDCSQPVREAAAEVGYSTGFLNSPGVWSASCDPLAVPRINLWDRKITDRHGNFHRAHVEHALYWRALHV